MVIKKQQTKIACILYPNTDEAVSYFEDNEYDGGVGAITLLPSGSMDGVARFLDSRLRSPGTLLNY